MTNRLHLMLNCVQICERQGGPNEDLPLPEQRKILNQEKLQLIKFMRDRLRIERGGRDIRMNRGVPKDS